VTAFSGAKEELLREKIHWYDVQAEGIKVKFKTTPYSTYVKYKTYTNGVFCKHKVRILWLKEIGKYSKDSGKWAEEDYEADGSTEIKDQYLIGLLESRNKIKTKLAINIIKSTIL